MDFLDWFWLATTIILAFGISFFTIPAIISIANKKNIADQPDNKRKLHVINIPTLGGIAVFIAILIPYLSSGYLAGIENFGIIVAASLLLFTIGLFDDLIGVSALNKLYAQCTAAMLLVLGGSFVIENLYGVLGIYALPFWLSALFGVVLILTIMNGYNFIDGSDGLAASIGITASLLFGLIFYWSGFVSEAVFAFVISAALFGFFFYNKPPAKIFMGDTGSLVIGFLLSILAIWLLKYIPDLSLWGIAANPMWLIAILIIPLYDAARIITIRLLEKTSPLESDKRHIHHKLLEKGYSPFKVIAVLVGINLLIFALIVFLSPYLVNTHLVVVVFIASLVLLPVKK